MSQQPQPDPYMLFLNAVKQATSDIGENMEGFSMVFCAKRINHPDGDRFPGVPEDQLVFTWATGGPPAVVENAYMEQAVNLLEKYIAANRGNLYVATEIMKARLIAKLMDRERQRRP